MTEVTGSQFKVYAVKWFPFVTAVLAVALVQIPSLARLYSCDPPTATAAYIGPFYYKSGVSPATSSRKCWKTRSLQFDSEAVCDWESAAFVVVDIALPVFFLLSFIPVPTVSTNQYVDLFLRVRPYVTSLCLFGAGTLLMLIGLVGWIVSNSYTAFDHCTGDVGLVGAFYAGLALVVQLFFLEWKGGFEKWDYVAYLYANCCGVELEAN